MSKAGDKLIAGARDALRSARCDHEWQVLRIDFDPIGQINKVVDDCPFCGSRRTRFVNTSGQ